MLNRKHDILKEICGSADIKLLLIRLIIRTSKQSTGAQLTKTGAQATKKCGSSTGKVAQQTENWGLADRQLGHHKTVAQPTQK